MTRVSLLEEFKLFTENATKDVVLPTRFQRGDTERIERPAEVYMMRLPDSNSAMKKAPYIIHSLITGDDRQPSGENVTSTATVRSIFCVYSEDEQQGGVTLLTLMEKLRIELLRNVVIGNRFKLNLEVGLQCMVYPDDTAPYYVGEMISTWELPAIKREVII